MKRSQWKNLVTKNNPLLKPVKRKCKGGYPCGTRPGDGGVVALDGGVSESVETAFWDMPFIKTIMGYNPMNKYEENEENKSSEDNNEFAKDLADRINKIKPTDQNKDEQIEEIVDEISHEEDPEDPNRAGLIRFVRGAHLVYKRQSEDGSYEEMWIYNIDKLNSGTKTKQAILAGTDIDKNEQQSADGKQSYEMWTAGNAQIIKISGLPN